MACSTACPEAGVILSNIFAALCGLGANGMVNLRRRTSAHALRALDARHGSVAAQNVRDPDEPQLALPLLDPRRPFCVNHS